MKKPNQIGFLIELVEQGKQLATGEQEKLLADPWAFKDFAMGREFISKTLVDEPNNCRIRQVSDSMGARLDG